MSQAGRQPYQPYRLPKAATSQRLSPNRAARHGGAVAVQPSRSSTPWRGRNELCFSTLGSLPENRACCRASVFRGRAATTQPHIATCGGAQCTHKIVAALDDIESRAAPVRFTLRTAPRPIPLCQLVSKSAPEQRTRGAHCRRARQPPASFATLRSPTTRYRQPASHLQSSGHRGRTRR